MLSVLSSTPQDQEINVYLDDSIEVTFSHEVHDTSLNVDNFRIYVMPGWSAQVNILSVQKVGPKVVIVPSTNLPANTQLLLWIRGDDNLADSTPKGVVSIIGEVMDGHKQIVFTTSSKVKADDNPISEIDINSETLESIDDSQSETVLNENEYLDIVGTYPNDGDFDISSLTDIVVKFDQNIADVDLSYGVVNNPISGIIHIEAENIIFGNEVLIPSILLTDVSFDRNLLDIKIDDNQMTTNTIYTITVFKDYITGEKQQKLPDNYKFSFTTKLSPMYASVQGVRSKGGKLIPSSLDNMTIARFIHDASIWASQILGSIQTPPYPLKLIEATINKAICELIKAVSVGDTRFIRDKQLADLRVTYNPSSIESVISEYCRIASLALSNLSSMTGSQIGIKGLASNKYPGSKRTVHTYNLRSSY